MVPSPVPWTPERSSWLVRAASLVGLLVLVFGGSAALAVVASPTVTVPAPTAPATEFPATEPTARSPQTEEYGRRTPR